MQVRCNLRWQFNINICWYNYSVNIFVKYGSNDISIKEVKIIKPQIITEILFANNLLSLFSYQYTYKQHFFSAISFLSYLDTYFKGYCISLQYLKWNGNVNSVDVFVTSNGGIYDELLNTSYLPHTLAMLQILHLNVLKVRRRHSRIRAKNTTSKNWFVIT